jgi:cytochrome c oxidase assembly protein subunit 15
LRGPLATGLAGIFALGALQGALGWYMVKSGLVDDPMVSPLRLAAHLGMAFLIYASMLWVALGLLAPASTSASAGLRRAAGALSALVFVMVLTGALVAGIKAGYAYNTWPLMNGEVVPGEILMLEPWWKNFAWNMATVQFTHRTLALVVLGSVAALWWRAGREPALGKASRGWRHALLAMACVQVAVGIATLVLRVPLPLAAVHQAGAVLVLTFAISFWRSLVPPGGLHR